MMDMAGFLEDLGYPKPFVSTEKTWPILDDFLGPHFRHLHMKVHFDTVKLGWNRWAMRSKSLLVDTIWYGYGMI
jgi:hypothetical protein